MSKNEIPLLSHGRPKTLDEIGDATVKASVQSSASDKKPLSPSQFREVVDQERQNTVLRRKRKEVEEQEQDEEEHPKEAKNSTKTDGTSESSLLRVKKRLKVSEVTSQALTKARLTACSDPRATFAWLAINVALCGHLAAPYKWNMDPTTFQVDERGLLSVIIKGNDSQPVNNLNASSDLCIFIKWIHLCSAGGQMSPLVFHIAIDSLNEEDFFFSSVVGLTHNIGSLDCGYLLFTKTRAGNNALWKWYFKTVCIPTINLVKNTLKLKSKYLDDEQLVVEESMRAVLSTDGENAALMGGMDTEVIDLFRCSNIDYVKISASTSNIHQACDRAPTFMAMKAGMSYVKEHGIEIEDDPILKASIQESFKSLNEKYHNSVTTTTSAFREKIYKGCLSLTWVFKEKYLKESHIKKGFTVCGQHRNVADDLVVQNSHYGLAYSTVDYNLILEQCYLHIPREEKDIMVVALPAAVQEITSAGSLSDEFMNRHNIMKSYDIKPKDDLTLNRQYAQLLSHEEVIGKLLFHLLDRHLATDPEERQKKKEDEQHLKFIAKYEKKLDEERQKQMEKEVAARAKEEALRKKEQEKQEELKRKQSLTKEQSAQEKKDQKEAKEKAKQEADQISTEKTRMKEEDDMSKSRREYEAYQAALASIARRSIRRLPPPP